MAKNNKQDFSHVQTDDPAFMQMMATLDRMDSETDIDPYASERSRAEEESSSTSAEEGRKEKKPAGTGTSRRPSPGRSAKPRSGEKMTMIPFSERGRDSVGIAKTLYCRRMGVRLTREEFILLMTEKTMKRLLPKDYERWKAFEESENGD